MTKYIKSIFFKAFMYSSIIFVFVYRCIELIIIEKSGILEVGSKPYPFITFGLIDLFAFTIQSIFIYFFIIIVTNKLNKKVRHDYKILLYKFYTFSKLLILSQLILFFVLFLIPSLTPSLITINSVDYKIYNIFLRSTEFLILVFISLLTERIYIAKYSSEKYTNLRKNFEYSQISYISIVTFSSILTIYLVLNSLLIIYSNAHYSIFKYENKQADYFSNSFRRLIWWNSLDHKWKDKFENTKIEKHSSFFQIEYLLFLTKVPNYADDQFISELFNSKRIFLNRRIYFFPYGWEDKPVYNLEGIRNLTNITNLGIGYSSIDNYSLLSKLKDLKYFSFQTKVENNDDFIRYLDSELDSLDISNNQFVNLTMFNELTSLKYLKCSDNQLKDLDGISKLRLLEHLDFSNNQVKDISFINKLINLKTIKIYSNPISNTSSLDSIKQLSF